MEEWGCGSATTKAAEARRRKGRGRETRTILGWRSSYKLLSRKGKEEGVWVLPRESKSALPFGAETKRVTHHRASREKRNVDDEKGRREARERRFVASRE